MDFVSGSFMFMPIILLLFKIPYHSRCDNIPKVRHAIRTLDLTTRQFEDLRFECGINSQSFAVSVTFFALPRTKEAACFTKDRREGCHIPNFYLRVKIHFSASCCDHVIAIGIAPAAPKETLFV